MLTYKAMYKVDPDGVHAEVLDFPGTINTHFEHFIHQVHVGWLGKFLGAQQRFDHQAV